MEAEKDIYFAGPFFRKFDYIIRSEALKYFDKSKVFLPDSTESSKSYDVSPGSDLAQKIFDENVQHIQKCKTLVFWSPDNDDLGTMMEVGIACRLGKRIMRYNYLTDTITEVDYSDHKTVIYPNEFVIKVKNNADAFVLGYNFQNKDHIYYELESGLNDNIMLSMCFKRVKRIDGGYKIMEKNFKEIA